MGPISVERSIDAPRERVFDMLTTPASVTRWWGPSGFTMPEIGFDLRVGGRYRFTMQPPEGEPFHLSGEFLEIDAPTRFVFTFSYEEPTPDDRETTVMLTLEADGRTTDLHLWQGEFATEERLELHRGGWSESFEKLRDVLNQRG